jgi:putative hydrolase of the HAD superfamily
VIKTVFLDAGETILHPHPSFPELFAATCRSHGLEMTPERVAPVLFRLVRNLSDEGAEGYVKNWSLSPERSRAFWTNLYGKCLDELGVSAPGLAGVLYDVFSDTSTYRLYDDALPAVHRLRGAGHSVGLISNFEEWLQEMLVELEVGHLFDITVISGIEGVEKPDPRIYEIALERAGVSPSEAVHVGDSVRMDVEPAGRLGIHTVLLDRAGSARANCPTIRTLEELPGVVSKL